MNTQREQTQLVAYAVLIAVLLHIVSAVCHWISRRRSGRTRVEGYPTPVPAAPAVPGSLRPSQLASRMGTSSMQRHRLGGYGVPDDDSGTGWDPELLRSPGQASDAAFGSSLHALQASPSYQRWARGKRLGYETTVDYKLRVYRALRKADPEAFERLFSRQDMKEYDSCPPPRLVAAADYLLASLTTLCLLAVPLLLPQLAPYQRHLLGLWALLQLLAMQLGCTSLYARALSMYATSGGEHELPASWWRLAAVGVVEALYLVGSAGGGLLLGLGFRVLSMRRQSVCERLLGLVPVVETWRPLHVSRLA